MADKPKTQKSQPPEPGVEPIDIPIPTRGQVLGGDLAKSARPIQETDEERAARRACETSAGFTLSETPTEK